MAFGPTALPQLTPSSSNQAHGYQPKLKLRIMLSFRSGRQLEGLDAQRGAVPSPSAESAQLPRTGGQVPSRTGLLAVVLSTSFQICPILFYILTVTAIN